MRDQADTHDAAQAVPYGMRVTAAVCWRLLVIAGALVVIGYVVTNLLFVAIPVAVALLLSALLGPLVDWLTRRGLPRGLATAAVLIGGLAVLGALLTFVIQQFIEGLPELEDQVSDGIMTVRDWLRDPPYGLPPVDLQGTLDSLSRTVSENTGAITSGAVSTAASVGQFATGSFLMLFTLIFLLHSGRRIWLFLVGLTPRPQRPRIDVAGQRSYASLVGYVRAAMVVAVVDAVGIGIGLLAVGAPLVLPMAALVFLSAFIPVVGAIVSGAVAVLVVLVANGPIQALIVLGVVLLVQQLEGNVLQPLLLGRAVALNGLAVVLAVMIGSVTLGISGALLAVPLLAVVNASIRSLVSSADAATDAGQIDPNDPVKQLPDAAGPKAQHPDPAGSAGSSPKADPE